MQPNEIEIVDAIGKFLTRVDLKGVEVPTFNVCSAYLDQRLQELQEQAKKNAEAKGDTK